MPRNVFDPLTGRLAYIRPRRGARARGGCPLMPRYYKAVRPDGTDFYSGTIDYAAALATGEPIHHPDPRPGSRDATHYLSVATEVTECTGMRWPCRVFVVEPGETWAPSLSLPHEAACTSVRVVEEVAATLSLGPQAGEITALIERCTQITVTDVEKLAAAWDAAWDAARDAARAAARAALAPTKAELQADAHLLVDRMLAVTGN